MGTNDRQEDWWLNIYKIKENISWIMKYEAIEDDTDYNLLHTYTIIFLWDQLVLII